jgi:PTH1 family peptidyl-tRNA hydrolase
MYIIVGLGNPGTEYKHTRHNIGFMVLDKLSSRHNIKPAKKSKSALSGKGRINSENVMIVAPMTFMNNSGMAVKEIMRYEKTDLSQLIVIYDDLDLDPGRVRVRFGGGSGGHNGIKSIVSHMGSGDFIRVRIGIGRPPGRMNPSDYVLGSFNKNEREEIEFSIDNAADAVDYIIANGVEKAMNEFNRKEAD